MAQTQVGDPSNGLSTTDHETLSPADIPTAIDQLITLHLHLWPALSVAIQNAWGTSSPALGEDKRAWLAGALSDLFAQNQLRDTEDLEDVLAQVMNDEFEVVVDDGTLEDVAAAIWSGRLKLMKGDVGELKRLTGLWEERQKKGKNVVSILQGQDVDQDTDGEDEWDGFDDDNGGAPLNGDVDMDEAPPLIDAKKKPEPEIDEDGFTKVVGKKKR